LITLKYSTQRLTSKSGDVWTLNYTSSATPQTSKYSGTIVKLYTPKKTQIKNINLHEGINFSPIGDSEIWFYPQKKEFGLNFEYTLGSSEGPIITRPGPSTTTTLNMTTIPNTGMDFRAYYLPWAVLLFMFLLFFLYRLKSRTGKKDEFLPEEDLPKEPSVAPASENPPEAPGNGIIYSVSHDGSVESDSGDYANEDVHEKSVVDFSVGKTAAGKRAVKESILNVLDESERSVVELMINAEGEITQAYIYKSTGMPKSSLSDTIKRLEKRNIIERKKEGRTNWLKLKEWVLE
jgi:DNA-binding transcriptional ArsR family regulator